MFVNVQFDYGGKIYQYKLTQEVAGNIFYKWLKDNMGVIENNLSYGLGVATPRGEETEVAIVGFSETPDYYGSIKPLAYIKELPPEVYYDLRHIFSEGFNLKGDEVVGFVEMNSSKEPVQLYKLPRASYYTKYGSRKYVEINKGKKVLELTQDELEFLAKVDSKLTVEKVLELNNKEKKENDSMKKNMFGGLNFGEVIEGVFDMSLFGGSAIRLGEDYFSVDPLTGTITNIGDAVMGLEMDGMVMPTGIAQMQVGDAVLLEKGQIGVVAKVRKSGLQVMTASGEEKKIAPVGNLMFPQGMYSKILSPLGQMGQGQQQMQMMPMMLLMKDKGGDDMFKQMAMMNMFQQQGGFPFPQNAVIEEEEED